MRINPSGDSFMAELEIFEELEQRSEEWFRARMGIVTASEFHTVIAGAKLGPRGGQPKEAVTRRKYMLQLIGERLTGEPKYEWQGNDHTERGRLMESEARDWYALVTGNDPVQVGFLRRGEAGASPDSLIDANGILEIKTKLPHLQLEVLLAGEMPSAHVAQVQGQIWVAGREWCDFVSYWPGLPGFRKRIYRDDKYIREELEPGVNRFLDELHETMERIKRIAA